MKKREEELEKKEEELIQREEETTRLREKAEEDAKQEADVYLKEGQQKLEEQYQRKQKELMQKEEETERLRENAERDAMEKAKEKIKEERRKAEEELNQKVEKLNEEIEERIKKANEETERNNKSVEEKMTEYNYTKAKKEYLQELIEEKEEDIKRQKLLLEKLLGRELQRSDFEKQTEETEELEETNTLEIDETRNFTIKEEIQGEIQVQDNSNGSSVFDISSDANWTQIGKIQIEEKDEKEKFKFVRRSFSKFRKYINKGKIPKAKYYGL